MQKKRQTTKRLGKLQTNYCNFSNLFVLIIGSAIYEIKPIKIVNKVCETQTSQPKAVPSWFEIPYKESIKAIERGKAPNPPLVKPTAKLPKIKPIMTTLKLKLAVSGIAKIVT